MFSSRSISLSLSPSFSLASLRCTQVCTRDPQQLKRGAKHFNLTSHQPSLHDDDVEVYGLLAHTLVFLLSEYSLAASSLFHAVVSCVLSYPILSYPIHSGKASRVEGSCTRAKRAKESRRRTGRAATEREKLEETEGREEVGRTGKTERSRKIEKWRERMRERKRERGRRGWLNPGLFARSKWRSAVILKFSRWQGVRIGLKNQSGSLFLMITVSRSGERELLLLSTDSAVSLPATTAGLNSPVRLSEPLSLRLFRVRPSHPPSSFLSLFLPSTVRFSLFPFSRARHTASYPSNFFLPFPHDASLFSATLFSSNLSPAWPPVSPYNHRAYAHTERHFVDRFKYGRCMRARTVPVLIPIPVPILAYRDLSLISIYKSYYIRAYRHSYDRTWIGLPLFPLLARQGLIASTACFHGDC